MKKQPSSIDGFIPRKSAAPLGSGQRPLRQSRPAVGTTRPGARVARADIDDSLRQIDDEAPAPVKKRRFMRRNRVKKPLTRRRKITKRIVIALIIIALLIGAFLGIKAFIAGNNIFKGNIFGILQNKPLQMEANGRSNILVFGTSEDDPGHEAAYLTDSILVLSIDQNKKNAYMVSVPRDLEVMYNQPCVSGYQGKINVVYGCNSQNGKNDTPGAKALRKKVGEVLGLDIQYSAHVNYSVVRDVVKALGGITVKIDSRDPRGIMDSNFDWKCRGGDKFASLQTRIKNCPPDGHFIQYPNGPVKLDAEHALYLTQARGDTAPTYGLEQSNFDREKNQQKVIRAIRSKAVSAGTITNVGKVTGLIDALGNNLRTNFETSEIRTLMSLAGDISNDQIKSISLIDGDDAVMNGDGNPKAGKFNFTEVQAFIKKKLSSNPVVQEEAKVVVMNGSTTPGLAQAQADKLSGRGFTVSLVGNAPQGTYEATEVYQIGDGKTATKAKLAAVYGVTVKTAAPPISVPAGTNFLVIFGKDPSQAAR